MSTLSRNSISASPLQDTEAFNDVPPHHGLPYGRGLLEQRAGFFRVHFGVPHVAESLSPARPIDSWLSRLRSSLGGIGGLFAAGLKYFKV